MQSFFGYLTGILLIVGSVPYIIDVLRHRTKPERATWLIWLILSAIAFFSQLSAGAAWSLVLPGFDAVVLLVIFILAIKYGVGGLNRRDILALSVAAAGLVLWYFTKQPMLALIITIIIDAAGAIPTIIKTYAMPETETLFSWIIFTLSGVAAALSTGSWHLSLLLYPAYILFANGAVVAAILLGRKRAQTISVS